MKTSNKILTVTSVIFLLLVIGVTIPLIRAYKQNAPYARQLVAQLSETRIHTLIRDNTPVLYFFTWDKKSNQQLSFRTQISEENVSIQGDTLFIRNTEYAGVVLPDLENYIVDGVAQPLK